MVITKSSKEIQNHITNIQWYADKILEALSKEIKDATTYDDISQAEANAKTIKEFCNNILECVK